MKHYPLLALCALLVNFAAAQVIITPISSPESLVACGEFGDYTVNVTNTENNGFGNVIFTLDLPTGMEYVAGSLQGDAQEHDLSNTGAPQFIFPGLPGLFLASIEFQTLINCAFDNEEVVSYSLVAGGNTYTAQEQPLANFFLPEVVITNVDNPVLNLAVNGIGQRTFTIIQSTPDAYLDTLFLVNTYDADMASLGADRGTLLGTGLRSDTILLTGADLPGGDNLFSFGDTLSITEQVQLLGCAQANSTVSIFWRCGTDVCQSTEVNTLITQGTGSPDLRITNITGFPDQVTANNPGLVGGGFCDTVRLRYQLQNLGEENAIGAGAVYDLVAGLGLNNNLFSMAEPFDLGIFPNWELIAYVNGQLVNLGSYHYPVRSPLLGYNLNFTNNNSDPDGPGGLDDVDGDGFFDDLPVGASFELEVHIVYDPYATDGCTYLSGYPDNGGAETNLRLGYHYLDQCTDERRYWYSVNDPGINVVSLFTHRSVIYNVNLEESNLFAGQTTNLEIRPDGAWNSPCSSTDSIVLEVVLPDGLAATGNTYGPGRFSGIVSLSGDTIRLASTERGSLTQPWGISVTPDCGVAIEDTTINLSFQYFCAPDCGPMRRIDCAEIPMDYLTQCEPCADGIDTREFEVERQNFGWTNSTHTQRADPLLDPTINLKAAIDGDSVAFRLSGVYRGGGPFDSLFARFRYTAMNAAFVADPTVSHFLPLGSTLTYYSSNGQVISCSDAPVIFTYTPGIREHAMTASMEGFFASGGCLEGIQRQAGDSLVFQLYTLVGNNTPRRATQLPELRGEFYLSRNGNLIRCNEYLDQFVIEQVVPNANLAYAVQEHYGCEEIYFNNNSIANPGHIYDRDQFPNEVRTIVDVSEVRIMLEGNWEITPGSSDLLANGSFDENDAVSTSAPYVTVPLPDPNINYDGTFTVFTYQNPGDWPNGDLVIGGSNPAHNIRFRAVPGCEVPTNRPFVQRMEADMIRYLNAPIAFRDTITSVREIANKTYQGPEADLLLASPQTFIPNSDTVRWDVRITNTTSYGNADKLVRNGWIAVEADPSVAIFAITDITDPNNSITYPLQNYEDGTNFWVTVGELAGFASRNFRIEGIYTDCRPQELMVRFGYSCFDYPDPDPGAGYQLAGNPFNCPARELPLYIQPSPVSLVLEVENAAAPYPLCTEQTYAVRVSNLQLATAYRLDFSASLPFGARIIGGTSEIEVPAGSGNWRSLNDPIYEGNNVYRWLLHDAPNGIAQLPGVNDAPANTYRIRFGTDTECGLNAGIRIGFTARGENSCGDTQQRRAFSERILIDGIPDLTNNYGLRLFTPDGGLQACDSARIEARLINLGPRLSSNIEYALLTLPASYNYVAGSHSGNAGLDDNTVFDDRRMLRFPIPPGVAPGDSISFSFLVEDLRADSLICEDQDMTISSVLKTKVACGLNPADSCDVLLILNSDTLQVAQQKDQFVLEELFHEATVLDDAQEQVRLHLSVQNIDSRHSRSDTLLWEIYYDQNGNGNVDPTTDVLVYQSELRYWQLAAGGQLLDSLNYRVPFQQACQLLAVLRNPNQSCFCEPQLTLALSPPIMRNAGPDRTVCSGDRVWLGGDNRDANLSFNWTSLTGSPMDLLPVDSAYTAFSRVNSSETPQSFTVELATTRAGLCTTTDTAQVMIWAALRPNAFVSSDYNGADISCYAASDGEITADLSLATLPVNFTLAGEVQNQPVFRELGAGSYPLHFQDANGCQALDTVELIQPDSLELLLDVQPVICYGNNDGMIVATAAGGTGTYTYAWSIPGQANNAVAMGLVSASYNLTLTDANECELVSDSVFVDEAPPIRYTLSTDSTRCADSQDGSARLDTLYGGFAPISVSWSNGQQGQLSDGYRIGDYSVEIVDAAGCTLTDTFSIPGPLPLAVNEVQLQDISCYGSSDGAISLSASGGTGQLTYSWNTSVSGASIMALPAGAYQVEIRDRYDCILHPNAYLLTQPDSLKLSFTNVVDARCFGEATGNARVVVNGGTMPYTYSWDHGPSTAEVSGLLAGNYSILAIDANGCESSDSVLIGQPLPLRADIRTEGPACAGDNGRIFFTAIGGTAPYRYEAGNGQYTNTLPFLEVDPDSYLASLIDARGCRFDSTILVPEPLPLEVVFIEDEFVINYGDSVRLQAFALNVRGDTLLTWTPTDNFSCADCLSPWVRPERTTRYELEVRDTFNCYDAARALVIVEYPERIFLPNAFSPNGDGQNETLYPFAAYEVEQIESFQVFNRWGSLVHEAQNFLPNDPSYGWDGNFQGKPLPSAVYVTRLRVQFRYGVVKEFVGEVVLLR